MTRGSPRLPSYDAKHAIGWRRRHSLVASRWETRGSGGVQEGSGGFRGRKEQLLSACVQEHIGDGAMRGVYVALVEPDQIPDGHLEHATQCPAGRA
jgi:hypothetical protein